MEARSTADHSGASRDTTQHGSPLEDEVHDRGKPRQATPPTPLFLDQGDPEAFQATVKALLAPRGQAEHVHSDTFSYPGPVDGPKRDAQDWPPLKGSDPVDYNGPRNVPPQVVGMMGVRTQPPPRDRADHVEHTRTHLKVQGQPRGHVRQCPEMPESPRPT